MSHYRLTEEQFHSLRMLHAEFGFHIDVMGTAAHPDTETRTINYNDLSWTFWRWRLLLDDLVNNHPKDDEDEEPLRQTA